ncbi:MAG: polyprenyl diphosphate synthase [Candidatus Dasytiphilus stammeri]
MSANSQSKKIRHVAIIMDGNGRWARRQGMIRIRGHQAGIKSVIRTVLFAVQHKLEALTLYAFSSENWKRPLPEVRALMKLFVWILDEKLDLLHKYNIRFQIIGDTTSFTNNLQKRIHYAETLTKQNTGLILTVAANYGGRWDIIHGIKKIAEEVRSGKLLPNQIEESLFSRYVCLNEVAPLDLVIRTGGEHRISNFLLWQIAYTELYFTDVLWPDFDENIFEIALNICSQRNRRFGNINAVNE